MDLNIDKPLEKIISKIEGWLDAFIGMLPNLAVSIVLLILFALIAKIVERMVQKMMGKTTRNEVLKNLLGSISYYLILGLGIFIVLGILGLKGTVTSLLAGVGVIGLALGFAFQDISANFLSGIILGFRSPFKKGDVVELHGIMGTVTKLDIRITGLKTFQGQEVLIPNREVLQNPIYNYTKLGKRRIDLPVGISYKEDLEKVEEVVLNTIRSVDGVVDLDSTVFDYYEFGSSSINFNIRYWIDFPGPPEYGFLTMRNKVVKEIKKAFDKEGITIPFPIRTLEFNGNKMDEAPYFNVMQGGEEESGQN
jgi:small conductance mechanosensitive channel